MVLYCTYSAFLVFVYLVCQTQSGLYSIPLLDVVANNVGCQ